MFASFKKCSRPSAVQLRASSVTLLAVLVSLATSVTHLQAAELKFGVSATLSGPNAAIGEATVNGLNLAVAALNKRGGVGGNTFKLIVKDDKGNGGEAQKLFEQLIVEDKVLMVFGPSLSSSAEQAWVVANVKRTVAFGITTTAPDLAATGRYSFRNAATEAVMIPRSIKAAKKLYGIQTVASIHQEDDRFTYGAYLGALPAFAKENVKVTTRDTFLKGKGDWEKALKPLVTANSDAWFVCTFAPDATGIIIEARKQGYTGPIIGNNVFITQSIYDTAKAAADKIIFSLPWSPLNDSAVNSQFIADYKAAYKKAPNHFAALAYDAIFIAAEATKNSLVDGDLDLKREKFRDALAKVTYTGATGKFRFSQVGGKGYDAEKEIYTHIFRNGKLELVKAGGLFGDLF